MAKKIDSKFGEILKRLLADRNVTQTALATEIGISSRNLRYYISGEKQPTLSVLIGISNYFSVSIDYLIGLTDDPTRH